MAPVGLDSRRTNNSNPYSHITSQVNSVNDVVDTKKYLFYKDSPYQDAAYVPTILKTTNERVDFFNNHFKGKELKHWVTTKNGRRVGFKTPADCEKPMLYFRDNYESFYHYLEMSLSPKGKKGEKK